LDIRSRVLRRRGAVAALPTVEEISIAARAIVVEWEETVEKEMEIDRDGEDDGRVYMVTGRVDTGVVWVIKEEINAVNCAE
jgi:hypothetical protein